MYGAPETIRTSDRLVRSRVTSFSITLHRYSNLFAINRYLIVLLVLYTSWLRSARHPLQW
mgnify:CR=1 FL=1